jgi:pilus assembly protein Flp/PilA
MLIRNERGQGLIEYLILTALVAVAAMGIVRVMGHSISGKFAQVTNAIQGQSGRTVRFDRVEESDYSKRDMSDFLRGAANRESRD